MNNIDKMIQQANQAAASATSTGINPANRKLVMIATDYTYEQYLGANHTDETLVAEGLAKWEELPSGPSGPTGPTGPTGPNTQVQASVNSPVAYQAPVNTQMADVQTGPMDMSMDALMAQGMSVDAWVKTGFHGLSIDEKLADGFKGVITMVDGIGFQPNQSIRFGQNPAQYNSTLDGITAKDGTPWAQAIMQARAIDPKCRPYRSVQVCVIALEDIVATKGGEILAHAGSKIGYATSVTGWGEWELFYRDCLAKNVIGSEVVVQIENVAKKKGANEWGIMGFTMTTVEKVIDDNGQEDITDEEAEEIETKVKNKRSTKAK